MLTDTAIRNAKPRERPYKLVDSRGLYLLVTPSGGKWWRFDYRFGGKRKSLSMGIYPEVALKEARGRRDSAREQLAHGVDPGAARKAQKAARADRDAEASRRSRGSGIAKHSPRWAPGHADKIIRRLERDVFPWLGARPVGKVTAPDLLACLRRIEARGAIETAHRALAELRAGVPLRHRHRPRRARSRRRSARGAGAREGNPLRGNHRPQGHRRPATRDRRLPGRSADPLRLTAGTAYVRSARRAAQGGVAGVRPWTGRVEYRRKPHENPRASSGAAVTSRRSSACASCIP